ncbi:MAG: AtpZ/AtpI family protein [Caulobacterales bacterium]
MADHKKPPEDDALRNLRARVGEAQKRNAPPSSAAPENASTLAFKFGGEFGAAVLVGALLGFGADYFLHSQPWGLVIGLGLGFVTGVVNVVRLASTYSRAHPVDPNTPSIPDDDED